MKYSKFIPKSDNELSAKLLSDGWNKLKEPKNLLITIFLSIPFMLINGAVTLLVMFWLYPPLQNLLLIRQINFTLNLFAIILFALLAFIFLCAHEFCHACFIPNFIKSEKTFWGLTANGGFVSTTEKITKGRFIVISIMPFSLLSIVLPIILSTVGWLNWFVIFLCIVNAMGSSVDFLNALLILSQVPNGAYVINNGFETYFIKQGEAI